MEYKEAERRRLITERKERKNQIKNAYSRGEITEAKMYEMQNKSFNKYLVDIHNSLLSGQEKYGYTYTLERPRWRKK